MHRGFSWGVGIQIAPGFYFSSFHWPRRQIVVIDHHHHWREPYYYRSHQIIHHKKSHHWRHNPHHRRGVSYHAGYQPTREFSGYRSYQNREQQREWAAQTRENKGYAPDRKFNHDKEQRFAEKDRQFERNKKGDELMRRAKEQGPRAQVEPTQSREFKDRQQWGRQELKNTERQENALDRAVRQPGSDRLRPERSYQTQRAEQMKFERPVQQPRVEAVRPERSNQTPRSEQPRFEQPRVERSYQAPRVEQPRIERSYQQPRLESPRVERSFEQPRVQQPRMEQSRAPTREMRGNEGRRQIE